MADDKKKLEQSTNPISPGQAQANRRQDGSTNDPSAHYDEHSGMPRFPKDYKRDPEPGNVHAWQREHIKVPDQGPQGYPLNVIIDPAMREMYHSVHHQGLTNVFDRFSEQQPQCRVCVEGLSCQLCANGPCRISPKAERGVCGVDAHVMVARNFTYRHAAIGTAANVYHCHQAARTLRAAAQHKESGLKIREPEKLIKYAEFVGLKQKGTIEELAVDFANFVIEDICRPHYEESKMVEAFAPQARKDLWRKLNLFPGGANAEVTMALTKCMTNLNADPVDFILTCVRMGVANEYNGLFPLNILQEILMGTQTPTFKKQNMGLLSPEMVNIITNGHMPLLAHVMIELASKDEWQDKARQAGANGIQVLGHVCEGQQLMNYKGTQSMRAYGGQEGEWLSEEYLLATGSVDLFMFDYNCSVPTLPLYAKRFGTKLLSVDPAINMPDVERLDFIPERMSEQAEKALDRAIASFAARRKENRPVHIPPFVSETMAGFSTEAVKEALGGDFAPLIDAMAKGKIRGVATIVGCTTARYGQGGSNIFKITKELIAKDILILSGGCVSAVMQYTGLAHPAAANEAGPGLKEVCQSLGIPPVLSYGACVDIGKMTQTAKEIADHIGVDTNQLPIVIGAPEYLEQKAVADACTAVALGWMVHVAPVPSITGSSVVVQTLTETAESLGLGKVFVELDAEKTVAAYVAHIDKKRAELGLPAMK